MNTKRTTTEITWLLGIALSLVVIPMSVYLADSDPWEAASYSRLLPSLSFVAVSIILVAFAEVIDLALRADSGKLDHRQHVMILCITCASIFASFFAFIIFSRSVVRSSDAEFVATPGDVWFNVLLIVICGFLVFSLRRVLGALE